MNNSDEVTLLVRIKGNSGYITDSDFESKDICAHFDKAIDLKTNDYFPMIDGVIYYIRFNINKKYNSFNPLMYLLGAFKRFDFKAGKIYKVKLVKNNEMSDERRVVYQLISVFGVNINDDRLDYNKEFEKKFVDEEKILRVFIPKRVSSYYVGDGVREASLKGIAYINENDNILNDNNIYFSWIEDLNHFQFEDMKVYRLLVRKSKDRDDKYYVVKSFGAINDNRFDAVKNKYLAVVVIDNEMGRFVLNKEYNYYNGDILFGNDKVNVIINIKGDDLSADLQMKRLKYLYDNYNSLIVNIKKYIVEYIRNNKANFFDIDINEDELLNELNKVSIMIEDDGEICIYFENIDLYGGHSICVCIENDNSYSKPVLEG